MLRFLERAAFISVRDRATRRSFEAVLGRRDVRLQPDIAFGLARRGVPSAPRRARTLGVSVAPQIALLRGRRFVPLQRPTAWYRTHLPAEAAVYDQIGAAYARVVRRVVRAYLDRGWRVRVLPFTLEDAQLGYALLGDLAVELVPYTASPARLLRRVAGCTRLLATRFHAHVFGIIARVPLLSLAYAEKCEDLVAELLGPAAVVTSRLDWVHREPSSVERLVDPASLPVLSPGTVRALGERARSVSLVGIRAATRRRGTVDALRPSL